MFGGQLFPDGPPILVGKGLEHEADVRGMHQPETFVQFHQMFAMLKVLDQVAEGLPAGVRGW